MVPSFKGGVRAIQRETAGMGNSVASQMAGEIESSTRPGGLLGNAFSAVAKIGKAAILGIGAAGGGAAAWGFSVAAQAEQAEMAFTTLLGSADAAKSYLVDLQKFAAKTPFDFPELRDAASRFIAVGVEADRVIPIMSTLGDATSLMGTGAEGINRATTALTQMSQKGKVTAEEMMQLTEAGIPAWDALAAVLGTDVKGAMDKVSKGTVTAEQMFTALETKAGPALARVAGGMEKQAATFSGQWATLKDTIGMGLGEAMRPVLEMVTRNLPKLTAVGEWAVDLFGKGLSGAFDLAGKAFDGIRQGVDFFVGGFTGEFTNEGSGPLLFLNRFGMWAGDAWAAIKDAFPKIRDTVLDVLGEIVGWIQRNWDNVRDVLVGVFDGFRDGVQWVIDHRPVLLGVLAGIATGIGAWATVTAIAWAKAKIAAVQSAIATTAAWLAAAAPFIAIGAAVAAVVAGFVWAYQKVDWFRAGVDAVVDAVVAAGKWLAEAWAKYSDDIWRGIQTAGRIVGEVFMAIVDVVKFAIGIIGDVIAAGIEVFKKTWSVISFFYDVFHAVVYTPLEAIFRLLFTVVEGIIKFGVGAIKLAWNVIVDVFTFFRDKVWNPLKGVFETLRDTGKSIIEGAVSGVKKAWDGIVGVFHFFRDSVYQPVVDTVGKLRDKVGQAFEKAVDVVKAAWDKLKDIVKTPINAVVRFYNDGIRGVWNNVISKIPGVGDLPEVAYLNSGGRVPGAGNRDTVPAMLTPGEFVIRKDAVRAWGSDLLEQINKGPRGTVDPAVFGYATGGPVKSVEETQAWVRSQVGKPYKFPMVGPDAFDCSGFTSALINFVLGLNPWRRRHSSGSVGSDPALARGVGDNPNGLIIGARPPYTMNSTGNFVGHTGATIAGLHAEATPPRVRVGQTARGGTHGMFPQQYHLPGFGGLSEEDRGIVSLIKSLLDMALPDLGGPPIGDLLTKLFKDLPKTIFNFLIGKMPGMIVQGVKDALQAVGQALPGGGIDQEGVIDQLRRQGAAFANGGPVRRTGPALVGENGPELRWLSRGDYIQNNTRLPVPPPYGRDGALVRVDGNIYGDDHLRHVLRAETAEADFKRRAVPAAGGRR